MRTGIGIDVGGTKIFGIIGTEDGTVLAEGKWETARSRTAFLTQMIQIVEWLTGQAGITRDEIGRLGIGLPGRVSGGVIKWVPNLPELNELDLSVALTDRLGIPVGLRNDGQLALLGEQWLGAAKGRNGVVMLTIGTGIGGAIICNGQLWEGAHGTAGSIGWLTMDVTDAGHPELGWFERMASGTAVNAKAKQLTDGGTAQQLFAAYRSGDPEAALFVAEFGRCLGVGIANLASILDPELILIGGGVANDLPLLLPHIRNTVQRCASPVTRNVPIVPAALLDRAGGLGALRLAFL